MGILAAFSGINLSWSREVHVDHFLEVRRRWLTRVVTLNLTISMIISSIGLSQILPVRKPDNRYNILILTLKRFLLIIQVFGSLLLQSPNHSHMLVWGLPGIVAVHVVGAVFVGSGDFEPWHLFISSKLHHLNLYSFIWVLDLLLFWGFWLFVEIKIRILVEFLEIRLGRLLGENAHILL